MSALETETTTVTARQVNSSSLLGSANLDASMYKAELEHERSLRVLDVKRADQQKQRLEKLVQFSQEELDQTKEMLEEERQQSELHMQQLRQARDDAIQQYRDLQQQKQQEGAAYDSDESSRSESGAPERQMNDLWQRKYNLLQSQMAGKDIELDQVRLQMQEVQAEVTEQLQERHAPPGTPPPAVAMPLSGEGSPAPSSLLNELNRTRIELAESERKQRQIRRAAEDWQTKAKALLPEREAARAFQLRVQKLEGQHREIQKAHQLALAENQEWQYFGKSLSQKLALDDPAITATGNNPPEVATILRHVEDAKKKLTEALEYNQVLEQRVEKLKDWKKPAEARIKSYDDKVVVWTQARKELEQQLASQQRQVQTLQKQEHIWKREIASLQELVQSFDGLPSGGDASTTTLTSASAEAKVKSVQLQLKSTTEELQLVKADRDRVQQELDSVGQERTEVRQEVDRVKEKYGKLREALEVQKDKAKEAEARAHRAEELSGMGSFNANETRVLHLSQNPLSETLRQQNAVLKKQLQEALLQAQESKGGDAAVSTSVGVNRMAMTPQPSEVNPDKLHKRLKESFKEQIGLFREGVYLMTGYKIDMLPGVDRPTFRVRSMYAAREEDHVMLKWPKLAEGESITSLDLLGTDWAKVLARSPSYDYMTKFNSLPAFLASVQLAEFEKQTIC